MRASAKSGCRFYPRCPHRMDRCLDALPPLYQIEPQHQAACYLYEQNQALPASAVSQTQQ